MSDHRLLRTVVPRHYDLVLEPDLDTARFVGSARIEVTVTEAVSEIVCNAAELVIEEASISVGGVVTSLAASLDEELERLVLRAPAEITAGEATLSITFSGELNDKLRGFYRSTFVDDDGVQHRIATTQFESTNARRAFPCWDEPDLKATFGVTLVIDDGLMAISSGAEITREPLGDGRTAVGFAPTMTMSTYLLAFVVGPLEATPAVDVDGTPLRVVHPIGKGHLTDFALDIGAFSLRHFSAYFDTPYPGDKLDLVAVPDFAFGAMENLGCATFREALLLVDPATSTQPERQRAADVIAHEIAHMWFGDLVTMSWWNGIWLKEAFATFCEMHCTDAWRPEWQRWVDFGLSRTQAFDTDALTSTRPIEFPVVSPDDAEAMYDVLTYEKGAAVVRMLEQYLGEDRFRAGIRRYLADHAYGNTDTTDLWDAIEATSGEPVRNIMDSWIFQGGHPVVEVRRIDASSVELSQARFGYLGTGSAVPEPTGWMVPMRIAHGAERRTTATLLDRESAVVDLGVAADWVLPNADGTGFYRVRFTGDLLDDVLAHLDALTPIERYGLVDDAWAALLAGSEETSVALGTVRRIVASVARDERDVAVWRRIAGALRSLDRVLPASAIPAHRRWAQGLVHDTLATIGLAPHGGDVGRIHELRGVLIEAGGTLGDVELQATARAIHPIPDDPERNAAAVAVIAAHGTSADFDDFDDRMRAATTPQDERRYLFALASFPGAAEMDRLLALVDAEQIRSQDAPYVLGAAIGNRYQGSLAWDYVCDHWEQANRRYPGNSISRMLGGITAIGDADRADRVRAFLGEHPVPQAGKTLDQLLERMDVTVALTERLSDAT